MTESDNDTKALFNAQTGKLEWPELTRHFARGVLIRVAPEMDLIDVATAMHNDDSRQIKRWLDTGTIARADDHDARRWEAQKPLFWATVSAPWVLVQEIAAEADDQ